MTPTRTPFIAGNWKMYKTQADAEMFISGLLPLVSSSDGVDVAICVPFTALQAKKPEAVKFMGTVVTKKVAELIGLPEWSPRVASRPSSRRTSII